MLMKTDTLGIPRFTNKDLVDMIYSGHADKVHVVLCDADDDVDRFNAAMEEQGFDKLQKYIPLDVDQKTFDGVCQGEWFMPDEYKDINVYEYVLLGKQFMVSKLAGLHKRSCQLQNTGWINIVLACCLSQRNVQY